MKNYFTQKYTDFVLLKEDEAKHKIEIPKYVIELGPVVQIDPFLREIESVIKYTPVKKTISKEERGKGLNNTDIMALSDDELDAKLKEKETDSRRMEKAWRIIASDVEAAIKAGKIQYNGKDIATNIKKNDKNEIVFDFTFQDADSKAVKDENGGKVPFTKNILAGKESDGDATPPVEKAKTKQILLEVSGSEVIDLQPVSGETTEQTNLKIRKLIEAGYTPTAGTYHFTKASAATWVNCDKESFDKLFKEHPKTYFKGTSEGSGAKPDGSIKVFNEMLKGTYIKAAGSTAAKPTTGTTGTTEPIAAK